METTQRLMNHLLIYLRHYEKFDNDSLIYWFHREFPHIHWVWDQDQIKILAID